MSTTHQQLNAQVILTKAFRALGRETFDANGGLISRKAYLAGKVVVSVSQRIRLGYSREAGSVEKLEQSA